MLKEVPEKRVNTGRFKPGRISETKGRTTRINTCLNCKRKFVRATKCNAKTKSVVYNLVQFCSKECRKLYGISSRRGKGIVLKFTCENCRKQFDGRYSRRQVMHFCSKSCKIESFHKRGVFSRGAIHSLLKQGRHKQPTSIEEKVYRELKDRGFLFEVQKPVGNRYIVDVYIPMLNLVIECDGDYWHSIPKIVERDKRKNAYLKEQGFGLLRLTETEIKNGSFKNKLLTSI